MLRRSAMTSILSISRGPRIEEERIVVFFFTKFHHENQAEATPATLFIFALPPAS